MADRRPTLRRLTVEERPAPAPPPSGTPIADKIDAVVRAFHREVRRLATRLFVWVATMLILLVVALAMVVTGIIRLGDALARLCGQWFGDQALADMTVGLVLLAVPVGGIVLLLRLRTGR